MGRALKKHLPGKEKIRLIKSHFLGKKPISEVCEDGKVTPASFYLWQRELFDKGEAVFQSRRSDTKVKSKAEQIISTLQAKLAQKNEVIAELLQENIKLKKSDGEI